LARGEAVTLKQQWQTGKRYVQQMKMEQTSKMAMGPQTMDQKMNMTMDMSTTVRKHEDGKQKRLTLKYDRMAMSMTMNGQEMAFDSAKPDGDQLGMGKQFAAMTGKELKMIANEKDEVTTIENFDEFVGALGGGAAGGMPISQMFTKEAVTDMVKQSALRGLPAGPVNPGDQWPWKYEMNMAQIGSVGLNGTYTLKGTGQRGGVSCAEIAVDGTLNFDMSGAAAGGDASGPAAMLKAMGMKMSGGKLSGTVWFDNALGTAREVQMVQEMEMTMNNPTAPDQKLTIPMKQNVTVTLTKVEEVK
jgi:hypothetical protein